MPETRLILYTRPGCHLCEVAAEALREMGEPFVEVDITTSPGLEFDYGHRVPVMTLDGKEYTDTNELRRDLVT